MTQLTQGSDMELKNDLALVLFHLNYGQLNETGQEMIDSIIPVIQADKQRSIDRAQIEAMIDELKTDMAWQFSNEADLFAYIEYQQKRIAELEQQLSPTTTEEKEVK